MGSKHAEIFARLAEEFPSREVKSRSQGGRQLRYITARTAMNRLDTVLGPESWWDDYSPVVGQDSVICRLTIQLPDGRTITKVDAGGYAGMSDQGDDDKSGFSDAFKRACVKFGIGRYLYNDGVPDYAGNGEAHASVPPVSSPEPRYEAPPRREQPAHANGRSNGEAPSRNGSPNGHHDGPPRSGKALYRWTMDQEQRHQVGLLKYLNSWAKLQDFPGRMIDWDAEQVNRAHAEAIRKLKATGQNGESADIETTEAGSRG